MTELCEKLGYHFEDASLLRTALTHPSYGEEKHVPHYQRLEFLGDAVLELVISDALFRRLTKIDEGKLTRIRAALVREETLGEIARELELGKYVSLSVGEERSGGRGKSSILSDVLEAIYAAVYLDGGLEAARSVILRGFRSKLEEGETDDPLDAKSRLQEILQKKGVMPVYEYLSMEGPPHAPEFVYRVCDGDRELGRGRGSSKQRAQQEAAGHALERMGELS